MRPAAQVPEARPSVRQLLLSSAFVRHCQASIWLTGKGIRGCGQCGRCRCRRRRCRGVVRRTASACLPGCLWASLAGTRSPSRAAVQTTCIGVMCTPKGLCHKAWHFFMYPYMIITSADTSLCSRTQQKYRSHQSMSLQYHAQDSSFLAGHSPLTQTDKLLTNTLSIPETYKLCLPCICGFPKHRAEHSFGKQLARKASAGSGLAAAPEK